jgi:hypothetical protein
MPQAPPRPPLPPTASAGVAQCDGRRTLLAIRGQPRFNESGRASHRRLSAPLLRLRRARRSVSHKVGDAGLAPAMGAVGAPFDNSIVEAFWARMQVELLNRKRWTARVALATCSRQPNARTNTNNNPSPPDSRPPTPRNQGQIKVSVKRRNGLERLLRAKPALPRWRPRDPALPIRSGVSDAANEVRSGPTPPDRRLRNRPTTRRGSGSLCR